MVQVENPLDRSVPIEMSWVSNDSTVSLLTVAEPLGPGELRRLETELSPASSWTLRTKADDLWAAPEILVTPSSEPGEEIVVRPTLVPTGLLVGQLILRGEAELPRELTATFGPPEEQSDSERRGSIVCPVAKSQFECHLPRGVHDVKLRARGFVSEFLWEIQIDPAEPYDIRSMLLVPGASVQGFVRSNEGRIDPEQVRLRLIPADHIGSWTQLDERDEKVQRDRALVTRPDERGFFQFEDVPPGLFVLTASHPGLATARRYPIQVSERVETALVEPVTFAAPVELELSVTPTTAPDGGPWRLELHRFDEFSNARSVLETLPLPPDGWHRFENLEPGRFVVRLLDAERQEHVAETVEVTADTPPLDLRLEGFPVEGRILLGDEPLPSATVALVATEGGGRAHWEADEDGRFTGTLPEAGTWKARVVSAALDLRRNLPAPLEIEPRDDGEPTRVDVVLPATRLTGTVLDQGGQPALGVVVGEPTGQRRLDTAQIDEEGRFEFLGLPEGPVRLIAEDREGQTSDPLQVELVEGRDPNVELVILDRYQITGDVQSALGPVVGALVTVTPVGRSQGWSSDIRTDATGLFDASLIAEATEAQVTVLAPGFDLLTRRLPVSAGAHLSLLVERTGGTLTLQLPTPYRPMDASALQPVVLHDGGFVASGHLVRWLPQHGLGLGTDEETLSIPRLSPGIWRACMIRVGQLIDLAADRRPGHPCVEGFLPPGGELVLTVPEP